VTAQEIFEDLKGADNKKLWAYAQQLFEFERKAKKKSDALDLSEVDFEDTASMRQIVFQHLLAESGRGNAQASDKLGKYLGLEQKAQDIIIQVVDFADAYTEDDTVTTAEA
jgi:hypothetical protein